MQSIDVRPDLQADENHPYEEPCFPDLETLTAEHGEALNLLAFAILDDAEVAERTVSVLLSRAAGEPLKTPEAGVRRTLSKRLYLNCTWMGLTSRLSGHGHSADVHDDEAAQRAELAERRRAVVALSFYGDHDHLELAELLQLDAPVVLDLMREGLDELCG